MTIIGAVGNGAVIPDAGTHLPEGARMNLTFANEDELDDRPNLTGETFPSDHPMTPYNREVEIAILKESIESVRNGEICIPFRQAFEELSQKYGLGPLPPE
ncbi:MAG TPA: hypothetical protein VGL71_14080 [Urbifossiella sp.]|jgi:hypothetical protein